MVLRRRWTLIGSHFLNALADGSGGDIAFSASSQGQGRAVRGLHRLRNSVVKATLGVESHPLPSLTGRLAASGASLGGPATLALHPLLGPFWEQAPLQTIFTNAFTGP